MLRIWSEHAIGFLKGQFQSLKSLRINITDQASHQFATYWIVACIALHAFAMACEVEERPGVDIERDPFIRDRLSDSEDDEEQPAIPRQCRDGESDLAAGKMWRERLKRALFEAKRHHAQCNHD
jgi:hypothetical protein